MDRLEPRGERLFQAVDREHALPVDVLAPEPLVLGGVLCEPSVGGQQYQEAAGDDEFAHVSQEPLGVGQAVY